MVQGRSFNAFVQGLLAGLALWTPKVERKLLEACHDNVAASWESASARGRSAEALEWIQARRHALSRELGEGLTRRLREAAGSAPKADAEAEGPPTVDSPQLSLLGEVEVESGIEQVRIERYIDQSGEWSLRELHPLCAGLTGRGHADPGSAYPMDPATCAEAFVEALRRMACPDRVRLTLMRFGGPVLGRELGEVYAEHLETLRSWGVAPAPLRIRQSPAARALDLGLSIAPSGLEEAQAEMGRVFPVAPPEPPGPVWNEQMGDRRRARLRAPALGGGPIDPQPEAEPAPLHATAMALFASQLAGLIEVLEQQSRAGPVMAPVWQRLQTPLQGLSPDDLAALQRPEHPFWALLDRIAALSAVQAGSPDEMRALVARLEPVLAQLESAQTAAAPVPYDTALAEMETLRVELPEASSQALESALSQESRRREIEPAVRNQLVEQLRRLRVPAIVQQFLLGPWVEVLTSSLVREGTEAPNSQRWMNAVADFTAAVSKQRRGHTLSESERAALLAVARDGMEHAGLKAHRIDGFLFDLSAVLSHQPGLEPPLQDATLPERVGPSAAAATPEAQLSSDAPESRGAEPWEDTESKAWKGHADLDTVPFAFDEEAPEAAAQRQAWISALKPGSICRLMLQGRWVTAQLVWRSDNGQFFMFKGPLAVGTQTVTRRVLERLRAEGLATLVEPGQTLARALRALPSAG